MGLPVHLCGRGGPPAGLPCGSQIPTYLSLGVRSLRDLDHHVTACSEGARACGGGGGCWACFRSGPISVGGGGGSKRSAPLFPGPQEEPAHGLHPRFVVAEIWADRDQKGGGGGQAGPTHPPAPWTPPPLPCLQQQDRWQRYIGALMGCQGHLVDEAGRAGAGAVRRPDPTVELPPPVALRTSRSRVTACER